MVACTLYEVKLKLLVAQLRVILTSKKHLDDVQLCLNQAVVYAFRKD